MNNTDTEYLKSIAEEIADRQIQTDSQHADKHLVVEAARLEKVVIAHLYTLDNFTQRETYYFDTLTRLVEICDRLYDISITSNANVQVLLNLLNVVRKIIPAEVSPKLKLPKAFVSLLKEKLSHSWEEQQGILRKNEISPKLIDISGIPFDHFINAKHKLYWRDFTWLKSYEENLENMDWENADCASKEEALVSMLIGADLNDDRFFIYCKKYIKERTGQIILKKRKLAELAECEKLILQDTHNELPSYNHRRHNISFKLITWVKKETDALRSVESLDDDVYKIEFNWDVDTIALFWKLLMEQGITKMVNVETYAKQIAATCSSKGKVEFKWETIKGRFYGKDQKYLKRIYEPFTAIIEDIRRFLR